MLVTFIIPTYNNAATIDECLRSIEEQSWSKDKREVLVVDGGSRDATVLNAAKYSVRVIPNPARSEEAARIIGIHEAAGELLCFVDADNVLVGDDWIKRMVAPFADPSIAFADTLYFSSRRGDPVSVRYQALIGGDDPLVMYLGIHSRWSYLSRSWTGCPHADEDRGGYLKCRMLDKGRIPPMGSNGFVVRASLAKRFVGDSFIHSDFVHDLITAGHEQFAKVKTGIVHNQPTFFSNKVRRIRRRLNEQVKIKHNYGVSSWALLKCAGYVGTVLPVLYDSLRGFISRPASAWIFHPVACLGLLAIYTYYTLRSAVGCRA